MKTPTMDQIVAGSFGGTMRELHKLFKASNNVGKLELCKLFSQFLENVEMNYTVTTSVDYDLMEVDENGHS